MAQGAKGLHIKQWQSGLYTNRAATSTPFRYVAGHSIPYYDALIDGLNMEITPANTLARRPGYESHNTVGYSGSAKNIAAAILSSTQCNFLDTTTNVYSFTDAAMTSIYTKTTTAQSWFQQVGNLMYWSDGTVNKKVSLESQGGFTVTNNGIAAPPTAPTIPNLNFYDVGGGSQTTHGWVANYTYVNSTGSPQNYYFLAPTGEVQWAVVAGGTTLSSAAQAPDWSTTFGLFGGVTVDGQMSWTNCGPITDWIANTLYENAAYVATHPLSAVAAQATITSTGSSTYGNWQISGGPQGNSSAAGFANSAGHTGTTDTLQIKSLGLAVPSGATITGIKVDVFRGANRANAVSDVTVKLLKTGTAVGSNKAAAGFWPQILFNNYLIPSTGGVQQSYGSNTDLWGTSWTPSDVNNAGFGFEMVANQASSATTAAGITYVNADANTPVTITVYYIADASDISGAVYAQIVQDDNGNLQRVATAGTSGGSTPTWSTTIGGTTTDGGVTWECIGTGNQLPVLFGWSYAFGFHTSGATEHISTMSPEITIQAPIIGTGVTLTGFGSDDTQTDQIQLYRTLDAGSLLLYDTSTTNVDASTSWTITDVALDSDLNFLIIGPVADANDPPPTGVTILAFHMGRMWAAVGNLLYFSAGPDCINGDGNQAWPPANVFTFSGPLTGLAPTSQGLVAYTAKDMSVVLGGPQTLTFWVQPLLQNFGIQSPNCLTQEGDEMLLYTTQKQLFALSPSGKNELGFNVAPTLANNFTSTGSYLTIHRSGQDQGLFISDAATHVERYNINAESWDTLATPLMGSGPIASIDLAGATTGRYLVMAVGGNIVRRNPSVSQDAGVSFTGFATIGSIVLSEPGENEYYVQNLLVTSAAVGTDLVIAVLPNEISGSFTNIPKTVQDSWRLPASSSINMFRYDWAGNQSAIAKLVKHFQTKITLPTENAKNEIFSLSII